MRTREDSSGSADLWRTLGDALEDACFSGRLVYEGEEAVDWVFLEANPALAAMVGGERVTGRKGSEVLPGLREGLPELFALLGRVAASGQTERLDTWAGPLGMRLAVTASPGGPGVFIARFRSLQDAEPRGQQEAFLRAILDHLPIGIAVTSADPGRQPTYMNDLFPRLYRTTRAALGDTAADQATFWEQAFEDPEARQAIRARVLADLASGDPSRMHWERVAITRQGEPTTYIDARNIPVPGTDLMISTVWDVTGQVGREEERRAIEAQLHQARQMDNLGLLAGGVAHDINNVLGSILALATVHQRKAEAGSPLRRNMETIAKACLRGGALVESLRGFARTGLRGAGPVDLNALVRAELRQLTPNLPPAIRLAEDLVDDLPTLSGDQAALSHAIRSLCTNGIEAMPEGGTLWVRTRREGADAVVVEVEDGGVGMGPEALQQAMAPFYSTKSSTTGTGLGLALVYGTVRSHGGTLVLQSEPGQGTLVRLRFPVAAQG